MSSWFLITLAAILLLAATYYAGEWACRRITARYAGRRRLWNWFGDDEGDIGG